MCRAMQNNAGNSDDFEMQIDDRIVSCRASLAVHPSGCGSSSLSFRLRDEWRFGHWCSRRNIYKWPRSNEQCWTLHLVERHLVGCPPEKWNDREKGMDRRLMEGIRPRCRIIKVTTRHERCTRNVQASAGDVVTVKPVTTSRSLLHMLVFWHSTIYHPNNSKPETDWFAEQQTDDCIIIVVLVTLIADSINCLLA